MDTVQLSLLTPPCKHPGERSDCAGWLMSLDTESKRDIDHRLCAMAILDKEVYWFSGCSACGLTYREIHEILMKR